MGNPHIKLLTRHPFPKLTESLLGCLLRVSQANGFGSPWTLLRRAGLEQHESRGSGMKLEKIAAIMNCQTSDLKALGYSDPDIRQRCALLGHSLVPRMLELQNPRVCPDCILEGGFIEAQWDLAVMIGCPVHMRSGVTSCTVCGDTLRWFRRGLLCCHCGATLRGETTRSMELPERDLLQLVRTKVLRLLPLADSGIRMPIYELQRLELGALLSIINVLGSCWMVADGRSEDSVSAERIVPAAARVLSEWPANFFELLHRLGKRSTKRHSDVRTQFAPLYTSLCRRKMTLDPANMDFIKAAFLDFLANHWNRRGVDMRTLKGVGPQVDRRFVSRSMLSQSLGIDTRTIDRHTKLNLLTVSLRSHARPLYDRELFSFTRDESCKVLTARQSAAQLRVSVPVLRALRDEGVFEVKYQLRNQPGFHEADVRTFSERVRSLPPKPANSDHVVDMITIEEAIGKVCRNTEEKANLIRDLLSHQIQVMVPRATRLWGMLIARDDLRSFIKRQRAIDGEHVMSCLDAAEILNCQCDTIKDLIDRKFLRGKKARRGWEIADSSVHEFNRLYVRLSSVAKSIGTSSRCLIALCDFHGVELCQSTSHRGSQEPFVKRNLMETLVALRESSRSVRGARDVGS